MKGRSGGDDWEGRQKKKLNWVTKMEARVKRKESQVTRGIKVAGKEAWKEGDERET